MSRPGFEDSTALVPVGRIVAKAAQYVPDAVHDMKRIDLFGEPMIGALPLEVELADRINQVSSLSQFVIPPASGAVVGQAVVPVADFMNVAARIE